MVEAVSCTDANPDVNKLWGSEKTALCFCQGLIVWWSCTPPTWVSWCVDAFLCLDVVLFGPFAVVMRCCEECLVEYLFVCNTMKWSDRNVFLRRLCLKLLLRERLVVRCVCCGVWSVLHPHLCVGGLPGIFFMCCRVLVCCHWVNVMPGTNSRRIFVFFVVFLMWRHVWVLIWCCLDRLRLSCVVYFSLCWKLHFGMLMCVCYLRVRAACLRHGVRPFADVWCRPEESLWPNSCVVCCVLCVSRDVSNVLCLFRVCTGFQNTWFPCLFLVWMISRLIPQGCTSYRVKIKSMRRTLWWSGKSWHLCWRSWSFIFRFPS